MLPCNGTFNSSHVLLETTRECPPVCVPLKCQTNGVFRPVSAIFAPRPKQSIEETVLVTAEWAKWAH